MRAFLFVENLSESSGTLVTCAPVHMVSIIDS
jgi:hypothetical protein